MSEITRPRDLKPETHRGVEYWIWQPDAEDPEFWISEIGWAQYVGDKEMCEQCVKNVINDMVEP